MLNMTKTMGKRSHFEHFEHLLSLLSLNDFGIVHSHPLIPSEKRISSNNPTARSNVCRTDACLLHNLLLFSRLVGLLRDLCYTSMCCRHTMSQSGPMILALTWQKLPERKSQKSLHDRHAAAFTAPARSLPS